MEIFSTTNPVVIASILSGFISIIALITSTAINWIIHSGKLNFDRRQAEYKIDSEIKIMERRLITDQKIKSWSSRVEFAQEIIADFYQAREIIRNSRSRFSLPKEAKDEHTEKRESVENKAIINKYYKVIERLQSEAEFFSRMYSKKHRSSVLFGKECESAYDDLSIIRGELIHNANMLILSYGKQSGDDYIIHQVASSRVIFDQRPNEDAFDNKLSEIILMIEEKLTPVLNEPPKL